MGILDSLRGSRGASRDTLYECRDCGTVVTPEADECPECKSTEIACYHV